MRLTFQRFASELGNRTLAERIAAEFHGRRIPKPDATDVRNARILQRYDALTMGGYTGKDAAGIIADAEGICTRTVERIVNGS